MPAKRKKERIMGQYFTWLVGNRNGIWFADGRSNSKDLGRHSLGTKDWQEALQRLVRLDVVKAVEFGKAPRSILDVSNADLLSLEDGVQLYLKHVNRPRVLGGATVKTATRYRAVLNKFVPFARSEDIQNWQGVSKKTVEAYGAWLDDEGYAYATEYLELTLIKQLMKWLILENRCPASCAFSLRLPKPQDTTTFCYHPNQVDAMVEHCRRQHDLVWLGETIIALATTGMRISELADLRWSDLDWERNLILLIDTRTQGSKSQRAVARKTKNRRSRSIPINPALRDVLLAKKRHDDGRVFHGPLGGRLKPDTVRISLIRDVLAPLANQFPQTPGEQGFKDGRLHSFRHYFCSVCANSGVPEQALMAWLGHRESKMVRRYYHLLQDEAQRQMAKINFQVQPTQIGSAG